MRITCFLVVALTLASFLPGQDADTAKAELIMHSGHVWTVDSAHPTAAGVAVLAGKITAVGSDTKVLAFRGPKTRVVDLNGRLLVPGFNDNHVHFASASRFLEFNKEVGPAFPMRVCEPRVNGSRTAYTL